MAGVRCGHRWPGGTVDGARGEVSVGMQGLHLLWVRRLAVPQYGKRELWGANAD